MNINENLSDIPKIIFNKNDLLDLNKALSLEWLISNGIGGYASSTILCANTRKYHGLLVASLYPPIERYLTLSKLDEELITSEGEYFLATNYYTNNVIQPQGYLYLENVELNLNPTFTYKISDIILTKKIFLVYNYNIVVIKYELLSTSKPVKLRIYPQVTFRDFHSNTNLSKLDFSYKITPSNNKVIIDFNTKNNVHKLYLYCDNANFKLKEIWNREFKFLRETERREDDKEDLLCPGHFNVTLTNSKPVFILASIDHELKQVNFKKLESENNKRIFQILNYFSDDLNEIKQLAYAADSFIVYRKSTNKKTIIAGYHWFSDWGRDTMISLPGLTLVTKRFEECREILTTFAENVYNGIIPNRFSDYLNDKPEYNTADASLWFFYAVYKYYQYTNDKNFIISLMSILKQIIDAYINGTDFGIYVDKNDGLVIQGASGYQLTWMDAKVNDIVVTPRAGKAVEINALWYNAISTFVYFIKTLNINELNNKILKYELLLEKIKNNFLKFKREDLLGFYDVIEPLDINFNQLNVENFKLQIRPNQIFAVSLPFSPLNLNNAKNIVDVIEKYLLTKYGLRSLNCNDLNYHGIYEGSRLQRDLSYHQGTVWAYLIGPFISAKLRVNNYDDNTINFCKTLLENFKSHLCEAGLLTISEIFDGDFPHLPKGCISQAWSVAEVIRIYYEDILKKYPLSPLI